MSTHIEVESKFDVEPSLSVPEVLRVPGATAVVPREQHLEATYFDTPDLRLLRHRMTLRRRTGGTDGGWHLKLPSMGEGRLEVHRPLDASVDSVPEELAHLVVAHTRGATLIPVARLSTRRLVIDLLGADGEPRAEVADDTVVAEALPLRPGQETVASTWREVEVEQVGRSSGVAHAAGAVLVAAGARPASTASKVGRALAPRLEEIDGWPPPGVDTREPSDGGQLVTTLLRDLVLHLLWWETRVRLGMEEATGAMRVTVRRVSSAMVTYRQVLDTQVTDPLRQDLRWLSGLLGRVHDAELVAARLREGVEALPGDLCWGGTSPADGVPGADGVPEAGGTSPADGVPGADGVPEVGGVPEGGGASRSTGPSHLYVQVDTEAERVLSEATDGLRAGMDSERYLHLLGQLERIAEEPPLAEGAQAPVRWVARRGARRAVGRIVRAADGFRDATTPVGREAALRALRKAVARARYAGEAASAVRGEPAVGFVAVLEGVQEVLERYRAGVLARAALLEMNRRGALSGTCPFALGILYGVEQEASAWAEQEVLRRWDDAAQVVLRWPGR